MRIPIGFSTPTALWLLLALLPVTWLWWRSLGGASEKSRRERVSLGLRAAILILLVFSLAGIEWVRAAEDLAVVFVLDASESVGPQGRAQGEAFVRKAMAHMGTKDRAALIVFGSDAWVEWTLAYREAEQDPRYLRSVPDKSHTDIGEALRLGLALLPAGAQWRLVLLSDGRANVPGAEETAALAAAAGAALDVVPLPGGGDGPEVWVEGVDLPRVVYTGERLRVTVRIHSDLEQGALVRLFAQDGALVRERVVRLSRGSNAFLFEVSAIESGFYGLSAQVVPESDSLARNNALGAYTVVRGPPSVLVVTSPESTEETNLVSALESAGLDVEQSTPAHLPIDLAELSAFASVVLVNVPASALSTRQMDALSIWVRDLEGGLVCVGGENSYGVGGYLGTHLEELLPVEMALRDPERFPPLAIVFVIDRSGSMGAAAREGGARKVDLAAEAVNRSLDLLQPGDELGVIAFHGSAEWVFPTSGGLGTWQDLAAVQSQVAAIQTGGGTDIYAGLAAAVRAVEERAAQGGHVILLTDGGASQQGLADLAVRLRTSGGTLSTIGVGQDAAPFLADLALEGGGRYHYTDDPETIPRIFVQETLMAQRACIVEEAFYPSLSGPSAILSGIPTTPMLRGYVATSIKPTAQMVLASNLNDPILAQWQAGLGRTIAWTSDAKGQWARDWVSWAGFAKFWGQAVRWTIQQDKESGLEIKVTERGEWVQVLVELDEEVRTEEPVQVDANLIPAIAGIELGQGKEISLTLSQSAPGRYKGEVLLPGEGIYLVQVSARQEGSAGSTLSDRVGYVKPFSPEYRALDTDLAAMHRLAEIGGGKVYEATDPDAAAGVFAHDVGDVRSRSPIWPWLLGAAICLLPFDIGVRRLALTGEDLQRAWGKAHAKSRSWMHGWRERLHPATPEKTSAPVARLMAAKRRAAREKRRDVKGAFPQAPPREEKEERRPPSPAPEVSTGEGTLTERLMAAKRRAQEQREGRNPE